MLRIVSVMGSAALLISVTASTVSTQTRPGEPSSGALKGPKDCVTITVPKEKCKSGKMKVCGANALSGSRTRTCT
jgi:hypothetical protein